jgi:hypothetical protein
MMWSRRDCLGCMHGKADVPSSVWVSSCAAGIRCDVVWIRWRGLYERHTAPVDSVPWLSRSLNLE